MDTLMKADIFFFIASIGFSLFFILICVTLFYIIRLIHKVDSMAQRVEKNIDSISEEAKEMIMEFRENPIISFLFRKKRKKTSKQSNT